MSVRLRGPITSYKSMGECKGESAGAGAESLCMMVTERVRSSPQDCYLYSASLHFIHIHR
jgi:hypothetical protein